VATPPVHPVRLVVTDDLRRSRLTIFFRLLLAIPHFFWLALFTVGALFIAFISWFATLAMGRSPKGLHDFLAGYVRYATQVFAYLYLAANPYPPFYVGSDQDTYPIDLEIDPPQPQNRLTVFFRIILAIPALFVTNIMSNLSQLLAVFSWFIALITGRVPEGIRNFAALALRIETQTYGYVLLVTGSYPSFNVGIQA
jgi:hypothetical protein